MTPSDLPGAAYDNKIYNKFAKATIEKKRENKTAFCEEFELNCGNRQLLLGIPGELSDKHGGKILEAILPGLASLNVCIALRGRGTEKYQQMIADFAVDYENQIAVIPDDNGALRKLLAASDACLFFSGGEESETIAKAALAYAALPIAPGVMRHICEDYNPNQESGNSFVYGENDSWSAYAAIVRANENFRFPYDWKVIQKSAIES